MFIQTAQNLLYLIQISEINLCFIKSNKIKKKMEYFIKSNFFSWYILFHHLRILNLFT